MPTKVRRVYFSARDTITNLKSFIKTWEDLEVSLDFRGDTQNFATRRIQYQP
jgi:hypothetical protein